VVEAKILALVVRERAAEQALDDVDRFRRALATLGAARPAGADHMLVQPFSGPEAERESIVAKQRHSRGACAMVAGWYRMIGHVTAVIRPIRRVAFATAPSTDHAGEACPCSSIQGKK
jgi:hypothetical protein